MRIIFKVHLRHESVLATAHLKVDMCRSYQVGTCRIGSRFDGFEAIVPFRVGR